MHQKSYCCGYNCGCKEYFKPCFYINWFEKVLICLFVVIVVGSLA
jgi:hypothetical protein